MDTSAHRIVIEENGQQQFIEYEEIAAVELPVSKRIPACVVECVDRSIAYTAATLLLNTGARLLVRGAVHDKRQDAYLWHVLTKTSYDRNRHTPLAR